MKVLDAIMVVLGMVSLVGSLVAMYVLAEISEAVNALAGFDTAGLGIGGFSSIISTVQFIIAIGWIWLVIVLLTSAYAVYVGIKRLRGKK
jgi:hypothetical protein